MARRRYRRNPFGMKKTTFYWILGGAAVAAVGGIYFATRKPTAQMTSGAPGGVLPAGTPPSAGTPPAAPPPPPSITQPQASPSPSAFFTDVNNYMRDLQRLGYNYQQIYNTLNSFGVISAIQKLGIDLPTVQQIFKGIDIGALSDALKGIDWSALSGVLKGIDWGALGSFHL